MKGKAYFLIIVDKKLRPLILRRKGFGKWELPIVKSDGQLPVHLLVEKYLSKHLSIQYKILGESKIIDSYDWPKEFMNITGKSGEENHFLFIRLKSEMDINKIRSFEYDLYEFPDYTTLIDRIVFKNHKTVLPKVFEDLQSRDAAAKEKFLEHIRSERKDYFQEIDRLY